MHGMHAKRAVKISIFPLVRSEPTPNCRLVYALPAWEVSKGSKSQHWPGSLLK